MTKRDPQGRCAVCGRRDTEPCCEDCHRAHDYAWAHPTWSIGRSTDTVLQVQLAERPPRRRRQE